MTAYTWGAQVKSGPEVPESGSSLRILICSNAYPPHFMGGAELMAHEQALALSRLGHDVRVFAADPLFAGHSAEQGIRHARTDNIYQGIQVYRIATEPEDYSPEFVNFQNSVAEGHFRDVLREFEPQIVHCHNLLGLSVKLPLMARMYGARTVCTLHDFWGFCLRNTAVRADGRACDNSTCCNECLARIHDGRRRHVPMRLRKDFIRLALEQVDRFIAPSHFVAGRYAWSGLSADRLEVIPNGIDIDRFRAKRNTSESSLAPVKVTYVGYLGAHKGVITLVEALALPPLADFRVILQLVGEGPEREACVARVNALGLQDRVHFLGKVQPAGMASIYAGSDIVALPSIWDENQPVCLMEAMAAGLPVIASRKGGIPELIDDGVNGLMFRAGDPGDLAVRLAALVADPTLRQAFGREGRRKAEGLDHEAQARRLISLYATIPRPSGALVLTRDIYLAIGNLRYRTASVETDLSDDKHLSRHFIAAAWIADCMPQVQGVMLTGCAWSALRLLGIEGVIPLPRALSRLLWFFARVLSARPSWRRVVLESARRP